jgi:hypothetical protein
MATAASTITSSLTPSQQAAREFWRQAGADGMPPFYIMSQYYAQLSANSDDLPKVTAAVEQLLTGLGYATDVDTVFGEFAAGQREELGYWAGRYCLFDGDGNRFDLVVGRNAATLTVPPALVDVTKLPASTDMASVTVLSSVGFSDGTLQLANTQFQASLSFSLPVSDGTVDTGAATFQSTAPRCSGKFVVASGSASLRPVNGKRGAWTQAGVNQAVDGDPKEAWYGQYVLLDVTDVTAVKQDPNPVYIYNDAQYGLSFQWGNGDAAVYGSNVTYNNNVLQCASQNDDRTQYAMQFVAPQAGAAEINLAVNTTGVVRSYKGYWVGSYPPPSLPRSQARLAKRPMTAVYNAASDASAGGYSKAIDVSSLTADATNQIVLPDGAVGNSYALTLNLTGCAATDKFGWTVRNDADGRAVIAPSGGATVQFSLANLSAPTDDGKPLQVTVQLTKTSATPSVTYTLLFEVAVIQCEAISLEPAVLPPVVIGTPYTQKLAAQGARGSFTWSVNSSSLPLGLTWDASSNQLSGTVADAAQVGKAFSLAVGLAASDVIMDPLAASLNITVQPAQAVATDVPPWERIVLFGGAAGLVVMGMIVAAIVDRIKRGMTDAKTAAAIREGNTTIEKGTNRNPRLISQSIVSDENATLPSVKVRISLSASEVDQLRELALQVAAEISKTAEKLGKLSEYVKRHQSDGPDDLVEDDAIRAMGYQTYGQVERAIPGLDAVATHYTRSWNEVLNTINRESAMSASGQKLLDDSRAGESNDNKLLDDEF